MEQLTEIELLEEIINRLDYVNDALNYVVGIMVFGLIVLLCIYGYKFIDMFFK